MILCNQHYNEQYVTLGNLPAVADDFKVAKHTVMMMGIPRQNTFELKDTKYDELKEIFTRLRLRFAVLTAKLDKSIGTYEDGGFLNGLLWE